ncbi:beta-N-acetylhexosaminidase [Granulicella sp. L60]|uniref:beta-N-acetylhexosaminidase n=1 Tax=Granulicella sp. L60 TaxID=1641866 RepID=UPI00131D5A24|nr:beta-N-acetylhexosaminidase [Granulicella sp. L60]
MKRQLAAGVILCLSLYLHAAAQANPVFTNTLLPEPAKLTSSEGRLPWSSSFSVSTPHFHDERLDAAIQRTLQALEDKTGTPLSKEVRTDATAATLVIDVQGAGQAIQSLDEDESYSLNITTTGARIQATTVVGAMRGLETFQQLLQTEPTGYFLPAVQIEDTPRFRWRGLMIDCGRHFEPVEVIKHTLDGMAAVKLNVFHWHLTEDQGFRIESKLFPRLTGMGSDGLFYTQDQAREIVAYARARGIRVVPEFDMPGHTKSWFVGYPDLASAPGPYTIRREFGIEDAAMDPTRDSTYKFIDGFIGEMAQIFPDPYMHIGGDESDGVQWKANPRIQEFMRTHSLQDAAALQAYFNQHLLKILQKHNKHMVGWDEVLNPALPKDVVIQSWRGAKSLSDAAKQGYQGILSQPYYLDGMKSAAEHYLADPLPFSSDLTPEQRSFILGGEICMWGEHLNERSIDSRIWPRSAAIAERFWSPEGVNNIDDMYRRLAAESIRLEALGLTHLSHQDAALRELAGTEDIDALRTFASVLEPVSFSDRYEQQHTSQLTPLDNLVDAVRPDPPSRHNIERLTHQFLQAPAADEQARADLEAAFKEWIVAAPAINAQLASTPLLAVAQSRGSQLPQLATAGLEALNYLSQGTKAPAGWKQRTLALIAAAKNPQTLVRFTFLPSLEELVNAVPD